MKKTSLLILLVSLTLTAAQSQTLYQPYSFERYRKIEDRIYGNGEKAHTALKPFSTGDSAQTAPIFSLSIADSNAFSRKRLLYSHQLEVRKRCLAFYADLLPDFIVGSDTKNDRQVHFRSIGAEMGGTLQNKLSFQANISFNQWKYPDYIQRYISQHGVIPGQREEVQSASGVYPYKDNWTYIAGSVSYSPVKYISIHAGYDKSFIGDGYRSILLSDFASPHPFFRLTGNLGDVQYTAMWSGLQDPSAPRFEKRARTKGAVIHYLDWNITQKLSIGFFDAVIWANADSLGNKRGFDWGYASPIIFLRPVESDGGSPDNAVMGLTAKYKIFDKMAVYGQFALDEFQAKSFFSSDGSSRNKWGVQLGVRGTDPFRIKGLHYLAEFNTVRPYTFSERVSVLNYAHFNEPLGHPYGANFREVLGMLSYSFHRFQISTQLLYSRYGLDKDGQNYGRDIFKLYTRPVRDMGNYIGQGIETNLYYTDTKLAYILNPSYNLRFEAGMTTRNEKNEISKNSASIFTIGLRSSFRKLYQDF